MTDLRMRRQRAACVLVMLAPCCCAADVTDAVNSVRQSTSAAAPSAMAANPAALDAAFDQVARDYGSFDNYLSQGLRLSDATLAAIRKNFLSE